MKNKHFYVCKSKVSEEEYRLRVSLNRVLGRIFGPKRDEVTGEWRRLHNKELYALYSSPNIIQLIKSRIMKWAGHVARMGREERWYSVLVWKLEGRRQFGKPRRTWEDNTKMNLQEVEWGVMDWIDAATDRDRWRSLVNTVMNLRVS